MADHGRLHVVVLVPGHVRTPLEPGQIAGGSALWQATRGLLSSAGVAAVVVLFDETRTWGLLPAVVFGAMTGLAVSLPLTAWSASRQAGDQSFPAIMRFAIVPMFLFGGAFYPIDQLPGWLQPVAWVTPLWHGVELCRGVVLGSLGAVGLLVHGAVLRRLHHRRLPRRARRLRPPTRDMRSVTVERVTRTGGSCRPRCSSPGARSG